MLICMSSQKLNQFLNASHSVYILRSSEAAKRPYELRSSEAAKRLDGESKKFSYPGPEPGGFGMLLRFTKLGIVYDKNLRPVKNLWMTV